MPERIPALKPVSDDESKGSRIKRFGFREGAARNSCCCHSSGGRAAAHPTAAKAAGASVESKQEPFHQPGLNGLSLAL